MSSLSSTGSIFMPPAASKVAAGVDSLYGFLLIASFISCVLVIGGLIWFAVKYRRQTDNDKTPYIHHNTLLEFTWSFIPFVIFMIAFVWGWVVYYNLRKMPTDALEVAVTAQKWNWTFTYKNGRRVGGEMLAPVGRNVKLVMTSTDVLHSFFLPAFRTKQDAVPGRYTALWFNAEKEGTYQVFCTEYCGDQHSGMLAKVKVVSQEEFDSWLGNDPYKGLAPVDIGQKVYASRCAICHNTDAQKKVGPGFGGAWGSEHVMDDGTKVLVDENYVRESILNPNAKTVAGYAKGVMPTFAGQLNEDELLGIIEYMKTLKK